MAVVKISVRYVREVVKVKRMCSLIFMLAFAFVLGACGTGNSSAGVAMQPSAGNNSVDGAETSAGISGESQKGSESVGENTSATSTSGRRLIAVTFGDSTVIYELNDGSAADSLYGMLPLTVQVEDYSNNEKIFYPEQGLDTSDSPLAQSGSGTLAYYRPWGDVVFFYGNYRRNSGLFELGQAVSGAEQISEMSGTIRIEAVAH